MDKAFHSLVKDHKNVKAIIESLLSSSANAKVQRSELLENLKEELQFHEELEENIVYPVFKKQAAMKDLTLEAYEEHHAVDILLKELDSLDFKDESWKAKLTVLQEGLEHHINEEEKELFPLASESLTPKELDKIGATIKEIRDHQ